MNEISAIAMLTAFAAGIVSFLSPCVLPLVPGYVSYMAGYSLRDVKNPADVRAKIAALVASFFFVLGFSTVFVALGASATALGQLLLKHRYEANIVGGAIVIVFGLFTTGLARISWFQRHFHLHPNVSSGQPLAAYVLGLAFGFGWTPCIGPVLGAILTVSAVSATTSNGITMLGAYSLGLGIPFLVTAVFTGEILKQLKSMRRIGQYLQIGAGVVMVIMGIAMITGQLSVLALWLLNAFPILQGMG
jgi:cytochrome c-type biogenesis protein